MITITAALGGRNATQTLTVNAAPHPSVCDRTARVHSAIVAAIDGVSNCAEITSSQLASIDSLDLSSRNIDRLKAGDFNGLINLAELLLFGNSLETLPAGIFDDPPLSIDLNLTGNPFGDGLPLALVNQIRTLPQLALELTAVRDVLSTLMLTVGTPIDLDLEDAFFYADGTVRATADNYEINRSTVDEEIITVRTDIFSDPIVTITPVGAGQTAFEIIGRRQGQSRNAIHTLTAEVSYPDPTPPVCMRTQQVQDAIVAAIAIAGVSGCADVTGTHLGEITTLTLTSTRTATLQSGDFAGLFNPSLELTINAQLETLPADIFAGLTPVSINLAGNPFGDGLPSALIDDLRAGDFNINLNLVSVQGTFPNPLVLPVDSTPREVNLEDAFFYADGQNRSPADDYEITVFDVSVATATETASSALTITAVSAGETDIEIVGIRTTTSPEQRATHTLTVEVPAGNLIFRIKVFLEGAQ